MVCFAAVRSSVLTPENMTAMRTFLYDYLQDPAQAIADACQRAGYKLCSEDFHDDKIYAELSSPEFRLYEEIVLCEENNPQIHDYAVA